MSSILVIAFERIQLAKANGQELNLKTLSESELWKPERIECKSNNL